MDDADIYKVIKEQGEAAKQRQYQLRFMIILMWLYMFALTAVTVISLVSLSNDYDQNYNKAVEINKDLTEILERRSPILDYLICEDTLQSANDTAFRRFIFAQVDTAYNPTEENLFILSQARANYEEVNNKLLQASSCPDLPS